MLAKTELERKSKRLLGEENALHGETARPRTELNDGAMRADDLMSGTTSAAVCMRSDARARYGHLSSAYICASMDHHICPQNAVLKNVGCQNTPPCV